MQDIVAFADRLAAESRAQRIILFGSHAHGTAGAYSDVDLLLIESFRGHPFDRATELLRRVRAPFAIDLLVRRPGETQRRYRQFDPLIREALDRGKVLYERHGVRVGEKSRGRLSERTP